jgi:hypothetical protein
VPVSALKQLACTRACQMEPPIQTTAQSCSVCPESSGAYPGCTCGWQNHCKCAGPITVSNALIKLLGLLGLSLQPIGLFLGHVTVSVPILRTQRESDGHADKMAAGIGGSVFADICRIPVLSTLNDPSLTAWSERSSVQTRDAGRHQRNPGTRPRQR